MLGRIFPNGDSSWTQLREANIYSSNIRRAINVAYLKAESGCNVCEYFEAAIRDYLEISECKKT